MKVTRIVKYNYRLTEESLEKDIDGFISDARAGKFEWDLKYGGNGLKIIKQYFRFIKEKFDKEEFEECARCYRKLILFLFGASTGRDKASFNYEDLLSKISDDFNKFIENYFLCLVKVYSNEELADECYNYIINLKEFEFDSDKGVLINNLDKKDLYKLIGDLILRVHKEDLIINNKIDIIYFVLDILDKLKDFKEVKNICERVKKFFHEKEFEYLKKVYLREGANSHNGEDDLWEKKTKVNGVWVDDETGEVLRE